MIELVVPLGSRRLRILCFSLILFVGGFVCAAADSETYQIPADVQIGEKIIPAGMYVLQIEENSDAAFVVILKGGTELGREKAIVLPARGEGKTTVTQVKPTKQELVRFRIRESDNWYILYLKTVPMTQNSALSTQH
jgi:hypothetical protein